MPTAILFPSHPLHPTKVEEPFEAEAQAAEKAGYIIARVSLELLLGGEAKVSGLPPTGLVIYRGWLNKPEQYQKLYEATDKRLLVSPEAYLEAYHLPLWYQKLGTDVADPQKRLWDPEKVTPKWIWLTPDQDVTQLDGIAQLVSASFGESEEIKMRRKKYNEWVHSETAKGHLSTAHAHTPIDLLELPGEHAVVVKDYVKSAKHRWYDACYIAHADDAAEVRRVTQNFLNTVGDGLVGSLVFRKYERFKRIGMQAKTQIPLVNEHRLFMCRGRVIYSAPYWEDGDYSSAARPDPRAIEEMAAGLFWHPFLAIDVAETDRGEWRIIEVNPGGEAGVPGGGNVEDFYKALAEEYWPISKCRRYGCKEKCWIHPEKGELVLCKLHAEEVFSGVARAPPLRTRIDYQSVGRKTFLVTDPDFFRVRDPDPDTED